MNEAALAQRLVAALVDAAARESGGKAKLLSVEINTLAPGGEGEPIVQVTRKTRSLLFLHAELMAADGTRAATAASVHQIAEG